ncbi:hypothetical protein TRVA0_019S01530 [Trichomonascus vanleenenianus]|uniref:uncharacterized protein n=1 Tax=Trichomonascus vanleenenianus TaxID=2268995 RepID=UPI003ECA55BA
MGSTSSKPVDGQAAASGPPKFPPTIHLYYKPVFTGIQIHIGEHKLCPKYAADLRSNWWGDITMYNGPSNNCPPIATAVYQEYSDDSIITLPDLVAGSGHIHEELQFRNTLLSRHFTFSIWVTDERDYHRETFRWRKAKGGEWELVRVEGHQEEDEIFARWSSYSFLKGSKGSSLQFVGRGAKGELGSLWAMMVVITWLRAWQSTMQTIGAIPVN